MRAMSGVLSKITQSAPSVATRRWPRTAEVRDLVGEQVPHLGLADLQHRRVAGPPSHGRRHHEATGGRCESRPAGAGRIVSAQHVELLAGAVVAHPHVVVDAEHERVAVP